MIKKLFPVILVFATFAAAQNQSAPSQQPASAPPQTTKTEQEGDPLLATPPLPNSRVTLIGGTVDKIDRVRNRLTVKVFGGGKMRMFFDDRTHIYRNGVETTMMGIKKDERVYVDTQLDANRVFARNIRIQTEAGPADARGQLVYHDRKTGKIIVRDDLSSRPVAFVMSKDTKVRKGKAAGSIDEIREGSLVSVRFTPETAENGVAQEIEILAQPGDNFTFDGTVTHVDVRNSMFGMRNDVDGKRYDIYFEPSVDGADELGIGVNVAVSATFDGDRYTARTLRVSATTANGTQSDEDTP